MGGILSRNKVSMNSYVEFLVLVKELWLTVQDVIISLSSSNGQGAGSDTRW